MESQRSIKYQLNSGLSYFISIIQNPVAKFCSKILKPLVDEALSVTHSSKDLVMKLSQFYLNLGSKYYIITNNVIANYSNISLDMCLDCI